MKPNRTQNAYAKYAKADAQYINQDTISSFCNTNERLIPEGTPITGLVLEFPGLDGNSCLGGTMEMQDCYENGFTSECAKNGIIVAYLFPGPWSWMNQGAVRMCDLVVDAIMEKYGISNRNNFRIVAAGGSMGGLGSLLFAMDSKYGVDACVAHCPCCNTVDCFHSGKEMPRTYISAICAYDMPFSEALKTISPEHRIPDMPDIPYLIYGDEVDELFPIDDTIRFVEKMKQANLNVRYKTLENQPHGGCGAEDRMLMDSFIFHIILSRNMRPS